MDTTKDEWTAIAREQSGRAYVPGLVYTEMAYRMLLTIPLNSVARVITDQARAQLCGAIAELSNRDEEDVQNSFEAAFPPSPDW